MVIIWVPYSGIWPIGEYPKTVGSIWPFDACVHHDDTALMMRMITLMMKITMVLGTTKMMIS